MQTENTTPLYSLDLLGCILTATKMTSLNWISHCILVKPVIVSWFLAWKIKVKLSTKNHTSVPSIWYTPCSPNSKVHLASALEITTEGIPSTQSFWASSSLSMSPNKCVFIVDGGEKQNVDKYTQVYLEIPESNPQLQGWLLHSLSLPRHLYLLCRRKGNQTVGYGIHVLLANVRTYLNCRWPAGILDSLVFWRWGRVASLQYFVPGGQKKPPKSDCFLSLAFPWNLQSNQLL